jgi:KUP system potassium uptake protein
MAQIMKLSYFPQIKVVHTSKTFHGQLYVPVVNWLMMIGTVLVATIYNNVCFFYSPRIHPLIYTS